MRTKVLLVSPFEPCSLGPTYERAFKSLSCGSLCFKMAEEYEKATPFTKNRFTNKLVFPYATSVMNNRLLEAAKDYNPGLVFIHKGQWISPQTLRKIKRDTGALLFVFNPDDPFNSNRGASSRFIKTSIPEYDVYFIWSKALMPRLEAAGACRVEYFPFAYDPEIHHPVLTRAQSFLPDVVFVGSWDEEREKWLSGLEGYNLVIWGADYWRKRCKSKFLRSCWRGHEAMGEELCEIIGAAKVNLNILRLQNKGSHNMRTFEIPACKGFMLHERSEEAVGFFREGKEAEFFGSPAELREKIDFYLRNDEARFRIAQAGYERCIKASYCYDESAKRVLAVYEELRKRL